MHSARLMPITLQALRESQRQLWKQKCTCGAPPGESTVERRLHARIRELEEQLRGLEAQLAAKRS
jgi:hypothetical protein